MPFIEVAGKRILFVHIPRTGGTSIEKSMGSIAPLKLFCPAQQEFLRVTPQHLTLRDLKSLFGADFFDYCFSVVRNPYDRIASVYRMRSVLAKERFFQSLPPFDVWLKISLQRARTDPFYLDGHLRPQADYIGTGMKIFKFETGLQAIIDRVSQQTSMQLQLAKHRHLSTPLDITIDWSFESRMIANEFYSKDFEVFEYKLIANKLKHSSKNEFEI